MHIVVETSLFSARAVEVLVVLVTAIVCGVQRENRPPK
jgi:hypothetical protein